MAVGVEIGAMFPELLDRFLTLLAMIIGVGDGEHEWENK